MSLLFTIGNYTHPEGLTSFALDRQAQVTQAGVPYVVTERWSFDMMLVPDQSLTDASAMIADLSSKITALEAAYKQVGVDVALSGTPHRIRHADTLSGIRVVKPPFFPIGTNAEMVTMRTAQIVIEADIIVRPDVPVYIAYEERIRRWGGGPEWVRTRPIRGKPQRQMARQNTDYMAMQSGSCVGFTFTPQATGPYWPDALLEANPRVEVGRSMRPGERFVSWEYVYASAEPFVNNKIPVVPGLV